MTKHYTIVLGLLIQTLFSFSQEDNWDVYMAQYEKGVGSTLVNMSLKGYAPMKQFPYLLKTGVKLINCPEEGLLTKNEFEVLYQISDSMKTIADLNLKNKSFGTFSYQCERTDYYYVNDNHRHSKTSRASISKIFP